MGTGSLQLFARQIETFFGGGRCFPLAKGRVACYVGLRAMGLPAGAKVLMPGYTCMVVPAAVQNAGLTPVYLDIDPNTYNLSPSLLAGVRPEGVAALIVQHTYGIPCDMGPIDAWARQHGIPIVEDCCHTFGGSLEGRLCGRFGTFAFLSGQWNKPFSTGLGGMLLVNEPEVADRAARLIDVEARRPSLLKNLLLAVQIAAHDLLVRPGTTAGLTALYRLLGRHGLVIGSSCQEELQGAIPDGYLSAMAPCQARRGLREMARIAENIRHRKSLTEFYHRELGQSAFAASQVAAAAGAPLLRYPVRVANKGELLSLARRRRIELGDWFEIPLHPAGTRMEDFGYRDGMCPEAELAAREVVNLPTHLKVSEAVASETLDFVRRFARPAGPATC